jgi:hypothetical protein
MNKGAVMSTWKVMKAIFGVQAIWLVVGGIIFFILGFKSESKKVKKTENGFQTEKMKDIYKYYEQKQKSKI